MRTSSKGKILIGCSALMHERSVVARGCPVLTTPVIADRFEGRWHLPTAEHSEGLAGWIQGWTEGRDVEMLCRAAMETRSAFLSDIDSMTDHVARLVSEVLAQR